LRQTSPPSTSSNTKRASHCTRVCAKNRNRKKFQSCFRGASERWSRESGRVNTPGKAPLAQTPVGTQLEFEDNEDIVSIFPTPSSGDVYLRVNEPEVLNKEVSFEVFDLQGKAVIGLNIVSETTFLDLKDKGLVSGVYAYLLTYDNGKIFSGKLVVE